jgi:hypothetical protein
MKDLIDTSMVYVFPGEFAGMENYYFEGCKVKLSDFFKDHEVMVYIFQCPSKTSGPCSYKLTLRGKDNEVNWKRK